MWEVEAPCELDLFGSIQTVLSQASITASFAKSTSDTYLWSIVHGHLSLSMRNQSGELAVARPLC